MEPVHFINPIKPWEWDEAVDEKTEPLYEERMREGEKRKVKASGGKDEANSVHPDGINPRNQFLIWPSGWQSWCTNGATLDLIT